MESFDSQLYFKYHLANQMYSINGLDFDTYCHLYCPPLFSYHIHHYKCISMDTRRMYRFISILWVLWKEFSFKLYYKYNLFDFSSIMYSFCLFPHSIVKRCYFLLDSSYESVLPSFYRHSYVRYASLTVYIDSLFFHPLLVCVSIFDITIEYILFFVLLMRKS